MEYLPSYTDDLYLEHHGVLGQKWGVRRYQNEDGTRTPLGKRHESTFDKKAATQRSLAKEFRSDALQSKQQGRYIKAFNQNRAANRFDRLANKTDKAKAKTIKKYNKKLNKLHQRNADEITGLAYENKKWQEYESKGHQTKHPRSYNFSKKQHDHLTENRVQTYNKNNAAIQQILKDAQNQKLSVMSKDSIRTGHSIYTNGIYDTYVDMPIRQIEYSIG